MKRLLLFGLISVFVALAAAQDSPPELPDFPDLDLEEVLACVQDGIDAMPPDAQEAAADWIIGTYETVSRLVEQRRRCNEISNDRLQQACLATWTATVLFEATRLRNDLTRIINDEEIADMFRDKFLECFYVPDTDPVYPE